MDLDGSATVQKLIFFFFLFSLYSPHAIVETWKERQEFSNKEKAPRENAAESRVTGRRLGAPDQRTGVQSARGGVVAVIKICACCVNS